MDQLEELIFNGIELLRNNKNSQMEKLKERLTFLLGNLYPQTNSISKNTYHKQKTKT